MTQQPLDIEGQQLTDPATPSLLEKLRQSGTPLGEYVKGQIYRGLVTGFSQAFVVDLDTHDRLIAEHSSSAEVLKPFLTGRDVRRWQVDYADRYLIKLESSKNKQHPWTGEPEPKAEKIFAQTYPAIHNHFSRFRQDLIKRRYQGEFFWELRSYTYWQELERSKIICPAIYQHQSFALDTDSFFPGDHCYCITTNERWLCGLLNSQLVEWFSINSFSRLKDDIRMSTDSIQKIPIPCVSTQVKDRITILIDYIFYLTTELKNFLSHGKSLMEVADDKLMLSYFEQIVNAVIMELYLPDEIHDHDKYFVYHLLQENLPILDIIKNDKMPELRIVFQRLFDRTHPIREGIFFLDSIPVVRTIRGLK